MLRKMKVLTVEQHKEKMKDFTSYQISETISYTESYLIMTNTIMEYTEDREQFIDLLERANEISNHVLNMRIAAHEIGKLEKKKYA
ncbi:MAG: hypothetical protein ACRDD7_00370 [Peptostreptococcaceae bacterium]